MGKELCRYKEDRRTCLSLGLEGLELGLEASTPLLVGTLDVSNLALLEENLGVLQVTGHVIDQVRLLLGRQEAVKVTGLNKVLIRELDDVASSNGVQLERRVSRSDSSLLGTSERVGLVVGGRATVAIDGHVAITLLVGNAGVVGNVDGDLLVVGAEAVTVGIGVGEETSLEHAVGRGLDTGDHVRGRESGLLDLGKVVVGVTVEDHLSDGDQGVVLLGPDLGDIEGVPAVGGGLLGGHDLDVDGPGGEVTLGDGVEEIGGGVVGVGGGELGGLGGLEVLDALVALEVPLDEVGLAGLVDELQGVGGEAVHVTVTIGGTAVGEEDGDLVEGLGDEGDEVPEGIGITAVSLGVALLGVDEVGELDGVTAIREGLLKMDNMIYQYQSFEYFSPWISFPDVYICPSNQSHQSFPSTHEFLSLSLFPKKKKEKYFNG